MSIPGLCRIWTRVPSVSPYWTKMTYAPRDYRGCLHIVKAYRARWPEREYRITADFDNLQPLAQREVSV